MTVEERNIKLKHFITCMKCEVSGRVCDASCPTQYEAGNTGEIIENLEAISEILEQQPCEMTVEEYRNRLMDAFHNADCDELIAVVVRPEESEFKQLEWLLKNHYHNQKQQPCKDAISRQAVLDTLDKMDKALDTDRTVENYKELLTECYKDLPSVTPKEKSEYEHDHKVVKAYNDGQAYILDKIRAEIEEMKLDVDLDIGNEMIYNNAIKDVLEIIDKYRGDTA